MKTHSPAFAIFARLFFIGLVFCLAAGLATPVFAARERADEEKAREAWMAGYVKYEAAAKAEEGGNQPLALDFYREALDGFKKVQARYPGWNPSLLDYRVNYCAERIRSLEVKVAAKNVSLTREGLISLTKSQEARLSQFTLENSDLKKRLELAGKSLEQARAEAATKVAAAAELNRVLQENAAIKVAQAAAESREAELRNEMVKMRSETVQKKKAEQLQAALDAALARQAELEQAGQESRETVARLTAQLKDAVLHKGQLEQDAGALKERVESLTKLAEAKDADLDTLRRQAEAGRKEAARAGRQAEDFKKQAEELAAASKKQAEELRTTLKVQDGTIRELKTAKRDVENARDESRDLQTALAKAEAKNATLKREKDALVEASAGELAAVAADRDAARKELRAATGDLAKTKESLTVAFAAANKDKLSGDKALSELQGELRKLTDDRNALAKSLATARQEQERAQRAAENSKAASELMAARLVVAEQKAVPAATLSGGTKPEGISESAEITELRRQLAQRTADLGVAQAARAKQEAESAELRNFQTLAAERAEELRLANIKRREEVQKVKTSLDSLLAEQQQAREAYDKEIKNLQWQKASVAEELDKANRRLAQYGSGFSPSTKKLVEQKDAELQAAAELQAKYASALDVLKRQKAKAEGDLAAVGKQLEQRTAELQQAADQADKLKKQLAAGSLKENEVAEKLADAQQDNERLAQAQEKLKTRNGELNSSLDSIKAAQATAEKKWGDLAEKATTLQKERDNIVGEARALKEQYEQSRQLARSQEEKLAGLEKTVAAQMKMLNDSEARNKEFEASLKLASDKISAMEGLLPGKGDIQAATTALIARVNKAEQENVAQEAELKSVRQELRQARATLSQERVAKIGDDPMLEQLRRINRELDQERDKTKALEQTVANMKSKLAEATPALVAAPAPVLVSGTFAASPSGEQQRRDADRVVIVNGFLQKGTDAEKIGKPEAAVWNYKKALEYQPDNKLASKRLGILASRRGNQEEAESHLRRAFYADPDDVDVLMPLGLALVRQGKADLAVSMLARAVSLRPEDATIHRTYGIACSQLGWRDAAEAQFRRTLVMDPKDGDTAFNLAVLLATANPPRLQDAQNWYKRSRELGIPADPGLDKLFSAGE